MRRQKSAEFRNGVLWASRLAVAVGVAVAAVAVAAFRGYFDPSVTINLLASSSLCPAVPFKDSKEVQRTSAPQRGNR